MILALQTSDNTTGLWLYDAAGKEVANESWESGRALADELLTKLGDFLQSADAQFTDLTGLLIFSGPGSFTSLRIGHTIANALADSLGIPVIGTMGDDWVAEGIKSLASARPGQPALPHYGAEANITRPKP